MPESLVYLLFVLGVVLVISAVARHERLGEVEKPDGLSAGERLRLGLYRYRRGGFIIGLMVLLLVWFEVSSPSTLWTTPKSQAPQHRHESKRSSASAYSSLRASRSNCPAIGRRPISKEYRYPNSDLTWHNDAA